MKKISSIFLIVFFISCNNRTSNSFKANVFNEPKVIIKLLGKERNLAILGEVHSDLSESGISPISSKSEKLKNVYSKFYIMNNDTISWGISSDSKRLWSSRGYKAVHYKNCNKVNGYDTLTHNEWLNCWALCGSSVFEAPSDYIKLKPSEDGLFYLHGGSEFGENVDSVRLKFYIRNEHTQMQHELVQKYFKKNDSTFVLIEEKLGPQF